MIVVTGATGRLGRAILEQLLGTVPADRIAASARDPAKANDLVRQGVRVRHGDFADPSSLKTAFEGADQVLIVSTNARASGGDAISQHRSAIAAAKAAGARRIVYTSHMAASSTSAFPPVRDHAATEAVLADSGVAWTSLRNGFYASTVPMLVGDAATSGLLAVPADGKVSWTTHADLAAAAAHILANEGRFEGPTPSLTAGEALDLGDVAEILSKRIGRPVERRVLLDEEHEAQLVARNVPQSLIAISIGLFQAARAGEFAAVDPTLAKLLGRQPSTVAAVLADPTTH